MSSESWPPQLKDWVAKCLGQMSETNKTEAQAELRQVIADAFSSNTLWTIDWAGVQLQRFCELRLPFLSFMPSSLLPKQSLNFNNLKRKPLDTPSPTSKKSKKHKQNSNTAAGDPNDQAALSRRAERFQREHELERQKSQRGGPNPLKANHHNAHLFNSSYDRSLSPSGGNTSFDSEADPNVIDWDRFTIVGTSQEIFKDYLRLTSEPKPEQIRPYAVLKHTLVELKKRWREKTSYAWICNQFKSLRQDLTVQRIKNEFTVEVYEQHGRMALEHGDMVEYNQCQASLKSLYELGIPGKVEEFTAYRILMLLHGRNPSELNLYVGQLTPKQKADSSVQHALGVQRSIAIGNYRRLFLLYLHAPNMGAYIMDHFIDRERARALMVITKAYMTISLSHLETVLAFDSLDLAMEFLMAHDSATFTNPNSPDFDKILDCRSIAPRLAQSYEAKYRRVGIRGAI
ncbi:SAC3/GANP/Nin1/mts3/eIF-3 p25 family-domain-containing protein [Mycena floridula]|nr:SAC3/GANP/Nin1/mts3/eIF-3 p25 family-domain-containing protein [Mycena floridula]